MPDLASHITSAYLASRLKRDIPREELVLFLTGNILPDILTRPIFAVMPQAYWLFAPFHTPVGIVLVCALISQFFEKANRKKYFIAILSGSAFHMLLDMLQKCVADVYGMLFPFLWKDYFFGLFWPDESLYILVVLLVILFLVMIVGNRERVLSTLANLSRKTVNNIRR